MSYIRKTKDIYIIQGNYGQGWEDECIEETWKAGREQLKCYRENSPYPCRLISKREKIIEEVTANGH